MNFVETLSRLIPGPPLSEVAAIVASVPKSPELTEAERAFSETVAARLPLAKRRAEIYERLNFESPLRMLIKPEQDQLEAEQSDIARQVDDLNARASRLRQQIDCLMPAYARAVAAALAGFRHRAAENLLDSIGSLEEAIKEITETSKALSSVGIRVSSVTPLQYATALRNAAGKILTETLHHG